MKKNYLFISILSVLLLIGCSGGGSPAPEPAANTTAVETCYDVEITIAGNSQTKNLCTTKENGGYNGLGVARFLRFSVDSTSIVSIQVNRTSGLSPADPDIYLGKNGQLVNFSESTQANTESLTANLTAGDYIVELNEFDYLNSTDKTLPTLLSQQKTSNQLSFEATAASNCVAGTGESTVSGTFQFDRVPHFSAGSGLDYDSITQEPIQQALVEVICNGGAYSSTTTAADGSYSLFFPNDQAVFVRLSAQMLSVSGDTWDMSVVNNDFTSKPIYVIDTGSFTESTAQNIGTVIAASGWSGSSYGARSAAPFAILDSVRQAKDTVLAATGATVNFPALKINWSPNNRGSFYNGLEIFIAGEENSDTDEYDEHVVTHEWGHYFEHQFSRSDSIGGSHTTGDILDIRVAFSEGFGNAFSAIVTGKSVYKDSLGSMQGGGFSINIENNACINSGWYSECSVQSSLYDIFDSNNDGVDSLALGFGPIYNVMVNEQKNTAAITSIFSFIKPFKDENSASSNAIDTLLSGQGIDPVSDIYGSSQITSNPGATDQLPVFESF